MANNSTFELFVSAVRVLQGRISYSDILRVDHDG